MNKSGSNTGALVVGGLSLWAGKALNGNVWLVTGTAWEGEMVWASPLSSLPTYRVTFVRLMPRWGWQAKFSGNSASASPHWKAAVICSCYSSVPSSCIRFMAIPMGGLRYVQGVVLPGTHTHTWWLSMARRDLNPDLLNLSYTVSPSGIICSKWS